MRLSNERCLEIIRRGVQDVLLREVASDDGRNAGATILRALDELLMRERAPAGPMGAALDAAIDKCGRLLRHAQQAGVALPAHQARFDALLQLAQDWRAAPRFADVHRELMACAEAFLELILDHPDTAASAATMRAAQFTADMEDELERAMEAAVVVPVASAEVEKAVTAAELSGLLRESHGGADVRISGLERIPGGLSKRTYRFVAESDGTAPQRLIARELAGEAPGDFDCWVLPSEYQLVRNLRQLGFPVPECVVMNPDQRFYVMRQSPGSRNASVFAVDTEIPRTVLIEMAEFLGRLHSIRPEQLPDYVRASGSEIVLGETMEQCVRRMLLKWRDYSARMHRLPSPIERAMFAWLWQHVPPNTDHPSILHGDFGPHNSLWDGEHLSAVLDWEGGHFGDPAFDLGYCRAHFEQRMGWSEFLTHYERGGGPHISRERLEYFERFAMYRTLITDNQCVARGEFMGKSDMFVLQVDYEYWPLFIRQTIQSPIAEGVLSG